MKTISMKALNHIKTFQIHIYSAEDVEFPDQRKIFTAERAIESVLDDEGIFNSEDRDEIKSLINWFNNDNVSVLNKHGWIVTVEKEEIMKK